MVNSTRPAPSTARVLGAALLVALLASASAAASPDDDREFVRSLASADSVDTRRLARLFFGAASTLEGGRSAVRLLQSAVSLRDPAAGRRAASVVGGRFEEYEKALAEMRGEATALLDSPDSPLALFRMLASGHHACWRLEAFKDAVEAYGATSADLMTIVSSSEACDLFREAAARKNVRALVEGALTGDNGDETRALREELRELERLLEDLRTIDESQ